VITPLLGLPWYKFDSADLDRTAIFAEAIVGVGSGRLGISVEVYKTETADFALVLDCRATTIRGFSVYYFHDHEQTELLARAVKIATEIRR
jgi:hypothetical protein